MRLIKNTKLLEEKMSAQSKKKPMNLRLDAELLELLKKAAKAKYTNTTEFIRQAAREAAIETLNTINSK